ncbi:hypothetical protein [Bradyrhizobium sp.]|uniref:hypothetical protein n=1 Tax=Bradyrhizobium sp. TaxID=376 RepID=UPI001D547D1F|nr:hypothetical protein [Bradyrhizobium sp.]MBI5320035.1 hypothetical protein [Bradyrhizobium sp.]
MTIIAETPGRGGDPAETARADVSTRQDGRPGSKVWTALAFFVGLALLMYVSIMFKIMKFGP